MSWFNPIRGSNYSTGSADSPRNSGYDAESAVNNDRICQEYFWEMEEARQKEQEKAQGGWFSWVPRIWPFSGDGEPPAAAPSVPPQADAAQDPDPDADDADSIASSDDGDQEFFDCPEAPMPAVVDKPKPDTANFSQIKNQMPDPVAAVIPQVIPQDAVEPFSSDDDDSDPDDCAPVDSDDEAIVVRQPLPRRVPTDQHDSRPGMAKLKPALPDAMAPMSIPLPATQSDDADTDSVASSDDGDRVFYDCEEIPADFLKAENDRKSRNIIADGKPAFRRPAEPVPASAVEQIKKTDQAGQGFFGGLWNAAAVGAKWTAQNTAGAAVWTAQNAAGAAVWIGGKAKDGAIWAGKKGLEAAPHVPGYVQPVVDWGHQNYPGTTQAVVDVAKAGTHLAAWVGVKAAENVLFWNFNPEEMQRQNAAELQSITGSDNLHKALVGAAPFIAKLIQEEAIESKVGQEGILAEIARGENPFIIQLLQTLLPKVIVNVHKHMQAHPTSSKGHSDPHDATLDILTHLLSVINRHFEEIHPLVQAAEQKYSGDQKKAEIQKIFAPLVKELLEMMMPKGQEELPVISKVQGYLWDFIKNSFLPDQLYDLYHQFMDPQMQSKKEELASSAGSDRLVKLCDMASEMAVSNLPKAIAKQNNTIATLAMEKVFQGATDKPAVQAWLSNLIKELGKSQNPELQKVWKFVGNSIEPIVAHVFANLVAEARKSADKDKEPKDIAYDIVTKMLTMFTNYVSENQAKLDAGLKKVEQSGVEPDEDAEFVALFKPLADQLLAMTGLDKKDNFPAAGMVRSIAFSAIADGLPKLLAKGYRDMANPQGNRAQYQQKLRQLLAGSNEEKTESIAQQMEKMCGFMAGSIANVVAKYLNGNTVLNNQADANAQKVWGGFVKNNIETLLLKVMVNYAERTPEVIKAPEGGHPKALLPANMVVRLADVLGKKLKEAKPKMDNAERVADEKLRQKMMRKAMRPLAREIIAMLSPQDKAMLLKELPLPVGASEKLVAELEKNLLPDLLVEMYQNTTAWEKEVMVCRAQLYEYYKTTHVKEACGVIAQYVADFVPHLLSTSHEDLAETVFKVIEKQLAASGIKEAQELTAYLKEHPEEVKALLADNMKALGECQDPAMKALNPVIKDQMEAVLLKVFTNLSKRIYDKENPNGAHYQPEFLSNAAISLMKVMADHFRKINAEQKKQGVGAAFKVKHEDLLKAFGEALHGGVPNSPEALEAQRKIAEAKKVIRKELKVVEKGGKPQRIAEARQKIKAAKALIKKEQEIVNEIRKKNFFIPFTEELLKLLDINDPNSLPVPPQLREEVLDLVKNNLLPEVLMKLYELMLDPHTLNTIVLSTLDTVNETLEEIAREEAENPDWVRIDPPVPEDDLQHQMNIACGELVLEMVGMMPHSLTNTFFKSEGIRKMAAEKVGEAVRRQLSQNWTIMKIIDKGIYSGLPKFRDGEWEGKKGQEVFTAKKFTVDSTGSKKGVTEALKFKFPKTEAEIEAEDIKKMNEEEATQKKLKKTMVKTVSGQIKAYTKKPFIDIWSKFQRFVDNKIQKYFGDKGTAVKRFCDKICSAVFFTGVGTVLKIIGWPFYKAAWFLLELYIGHKANHVIQNMHMGIHENMMYKASETIVNLLKPVDVDKETTKHQMEQIIKAAEKRKAQAHIEELRRRHEAFIDELDAQEQDDDFKFEDVHVALMGAATTPKVLAANHDRKSLKNGLEALEGLFQIYPIKGDGHCLFRSVAAGLLMHAQAKGPDAADALFDNIQRALTGNQRLELAADLAKMKSIIQRLYQESPESVEKIMLDKANSDELVRVLRRLACAYNRENASQTLQEEAAASEMSLNEYLQAIEDMDQKSMGGQPEIVALSKCLQIDLRALDAAAIGQGADPFAGGEDAKLPKLWLLFRGDHYDLAVET